jgi:uncharacterized membrane protein (GlpM family)
MTIFFIKFFVTVFAVILIAEVAKRINPNIAGILMGLPLGAAISVYFFDYEQGTDFVLAAIPWGIAGLSSTVVFALAYLCAGRLCAGWRPAAQIAASGAASLLAWAVSAVLLRFVRMSLAVATAIFAAAIILNILILRKIRRPTGKTSDKASSLKVILLRAAAAGITISLVTGFAQLIGSSWSGIVSAFPVMMLPLMIVLHYEDGHRSYPGIVYSYAYSIPNLLVFYLCLYFFLPRIGINISYIILYSISALILWLLNKLRVKDEKYGRLGG